MYNNEYQPTNVVSNKDDVRKEYNKISDNNTSYKTYDTQFNKKTNYNSLNSKSNNAIPDSYDFQNNQQHKSYNTANNVAMCYELCDTNIRDIEYIGSLYPFESRIIKEFVDDELDKLEYEGSILFHEYPDKVYLQSIIDAIENMLNNDSSSDNINSSEANIKMNNNISMQQQCGGPNCPPPPFPYPPRFRRPNRQPNWYRSLIETLFFNEMHNRRRRYFDINRRLY